MENIPSPILRPEPKALPCIRWLLAAFLFLVITGLTTPVNGELYQYVDEKGTMHLTNVPSDSRFQRVEMRDGNLIHAVSRRELEKTIALYSKEHRLNPALLRAVIQAESDFNPAALSRSGAMGLMQLMPTTAAALNVRNPYNPVENIDGGSRHLRYLLDQFHGKLPLALAAYNAGESSVRQYRNIPPYKETQQYVRKVLRLYQGYLSQKHRPFSPTTPQGHLR